MTATERLHDASPSLLAACEAALKYLRAREPKVYAGESPERIAVATVRLQLEAAIERAGGAS